MGYWLKRRKVSLGRITFFANCFEYTNLVKYLLLRREANERRFLFVLALFSCFSRRPLLRTCGNRSVKPTKYNLIKSMSALSLTEVSPLNTALYVNDNSIFTS